jgi:hypothetical protein
MYELVKAAKYESRFISNFALWQTGKGANWLSKENAVKNHITVLR